MEISLAISDANEVVSNPIQAENTNKYMDVVFYNAAVKGEIDVVEEQADNLARLLTPRNNTILHINVLARPKEMKSIEFVRSVLDKCPPLLFHANDKGETPLHIAARFGHHQVVEVLLEHAKSPRNEKLESGTRQILQMTSKQKDTALHEAVRMNHTHVVELLIKEDPDFSYSANKTGETPLYLAVERSYTHLAFLILDRCTSIVHRGSNGRTTLHAAVINQDQEMTRRILERTKSTLTSQVDDEGWTPLHHCAASFRGCLVILKMLLEADKSAAYISSKNDQLTPLHIAIQQKNIDIIKELILQCPDSSELVDHQEQNVLHLSADRYFRDIWSFLLKNPAIEKLLNDKDNEGNTPLHVLAAAHPIYFVDGIVRHPLPGLLGTNEVNNENKTALDVFLEIQSGRLFLEVLETVMPKFGIWKRIRWKIINRKTKGFFEHYVSALYEARESHLIVAILIATVTFAAGFTLPGGYNSEKGDPGRGLAILSRKSAFQAFIISDTVVMVLSSSAVFLHFLLAMTTSSNLSPTKPMTTSSNLSPTKPSKLFFVAYILTVYAMEAMIIAFAVGTYSVLGNSSALSIIIIIISLLFFLFSIPATIQLYLNI